MGMPLKQGQTKPTWQEINQPVHRSPFPLYRSSSVHMEIQSAGCLVPSRFRVTRAAGGKRERERRLGTSQIRGVFIDHKHKNSRLNSLDRLEVNQLAIYKHGQRVQLRT